MGHLGSLGLSCHRREEEGKEGGRKEEGRREEGRKAKSSALKSNNPTLKGGE